MRRLPLPAPFALAVALAGAAAQTPGKAQPPHRTLTPELLAAARVACGQDPLAALRESLRPQDPDAPPRTPLPQTDPAWRPFLVAALWSDDQEVAYAVTNQLDQYWLDLADMDRWLALAWPHRHDARAHFAWDTFKDILSTEQIHAYLADPPSWRTDLRGIAIGDLHRALRPEHIPDLAALLLDDDPLLQQQALEQMYQLTNYTRRHREAVARALLAYPGPRELVGADFDDRSKYPRPEPIAYALPEARPGWSPLLRATLQHELLDTAPAKNRPDFVPMLLRWSNDEAPAEPDRLLLRALLDSPHDGAPLLALRGLCRLPPGPLTDRLLAEPPEAWPAALVHAARREFEDLRELARTDADALAVGLEFDLTATWTQWLADTFGVDAERGSAAIELLADARLVQRHRAGLAPAAIDALLRQAIDLHGERLDHARLHRLVTAFPLARSDALVDRYLATLEPQHLKGQCAAEILEVARPAEFQARLAEFVRSGPDACKGHAIDLMLAMGRCPIGGTAILAHCRAGEAVDRFVLARNAIVREVAELLDGELRALDVADAKILETTMEPLAVAAMVHGLPEPLARSLAREFAGQDELVHARLPQWRDQVLGGDPAAMLVDFLGALPATEVSVMNLGLCTDERVLAMLRRIRATPGAAVQWAIRELAMAGDDDALREADEVRCRHLYGWLDDGYGLAQAGGQNLRLMPWLIGELETICCRRNGASEVIDNLTGYDVFLTTEDALLTQREVTQRWWDAVGEHMVWSRIAQKFVVTAF